MNAPESWKISDGFWEKAAPLLPRKERNPERAYRRRFGGGRPPLKARQVLEAIFYVLRTGIPWKALPKEFGASSAVHRYFRFWYREGFFKALWDAGLGTYEEAAGIQWAWLSADESIGEGAAQDTGERGKPQRQTPYARRRRHHQLPASGFNVCD